MINKEKKEAFKNLNDIERNKVKEIISYKKIIKKLQEIEVNPEYISKIVKKIESNFPKVKIFLES